MDYRLTPEQFGLARIVYEALTVTDAWPNYAYVQANLEDSHRCDPVAAVAGLPVGLIQLPNPPGDDREVKITLKGLTALARQDDRFRPRIGTFMALFHWFMQQEQSIPFLPNEVRRVHLTSDDAMNKGGFDPRETLQALQIATVDSPIWYGGGGWNIQDTTWNCVIRPDIRKFRRMQTIVDYFEVDDGARQGPPAPEPPFDVVPVSIESLTPHPPPPESAEVDDEPVLVGLRKLSEPIANSYAQAKTDLNDSTRTSWVGTAHEIREVITRLLRMLAPDEDVAAQPWFKREPNTKGPTQKQRARYVLEQRKANEKQIDVAERAGTLDDMASDLIRSVYQRANSAAHMETDRAEVARLMRYLEAFAHDLLGL